MDKCPFRLDIEFEYGETKQGTNVVTKQKELYPDCYKDRCACYKYDVSKGGWYCVQVEGLDRSNDE
jgi:hypothetical protein